MHLIPSRVEFLKSCASGVRQKGRETISAIWRRCHSQSSRAEYKQLDSPDSASSGNVAVKTWLYQTSDSEAPAVQTPIDSEVHAMAVHGNLHWSATQTESSVNLLSRTAEQAPAVEMRAESEYHPPGIVPAHNTPVICSDVSPESVYYEESLRSLDVDAVDNPLLGNLDTSSNATPSVSSALATASDSSRRGKVYAHQAWTPPEEDFAISVEEQRGRAVRTMYELRKILQKKERRGELRAGTIDLRFRQCAHRWRNTLREQTAASEGLRRKVAERRREESIAFEKYLTRQQMVERAAQACRASDVVQPIRLTLVQSSGLVAPFTSPVSSIEGQDLRSCRVSAVDRPAPDDSYLPPSDNGHAAASRHSYRFGDVVRDVAGHVGGNPFC